jgi:predicted Zn-ribbon and HTH transcriptional regulator
MLELLSTVALVGLFAAAASLLRPTRCPRCRARKLRFEEFEPWHGLDRCTACGWESKPYTVDL